MKIIIRGVLLGSASLAVVAGSQAVNAQATTTRAERTASDETAEIVVTANKREQNLNDVGLSITALTAATLQNRQIQTLQDIASVVPGLSFSESPSNTPVLTLRGVGYDSRALGSYPAVSLYVDQQPLPFPVLGSHAAYDLERIEVLKGPQGTLFGQNATGGAINFIAAKPTSRFEAGGDITYARFNRIEGNAYISGPMTDTLRGRIAVNGVNSDGWQVSTSRPHDRNGRTSYVAGRMIVDWDPTDAMRFSLNVNGWTDKSDPQARQFIGIYQTVNGGSPAGVLAQPFSPQTPRAADWSATREPSADRKLYQFSLRGDVDLTDALTLTSLTSYVHYKQVSMQDTDGTPFEIQDNIDSGTIRSFNQELRLANDPSAHFRWVLGANYEESRTYNFQRADFRQNSVGILFTSSEGFVRQNIRNYAFFGNVEFDLTERLTAKGGVRYTNSRNNAALCAGDGGDGGLARFFNGLGTGNPGFVPVGITGPLDRRCATLTAVGGIPTLTPSHVSLSEDNVSWRVGLDYKISDDTLLYANVSKGYKAGSFPLLAATFVAQYRPVTQESLLAYEAGIKADLLGRFAHINAAAFYYDYRDKQVLGRGTFPPFGPQQLLVNVPKSRVYGFESDLTLRPLDRLTLTGSVTYLNTRIREYTGFNSIAAIQNFAGQDLPFAPKWSYAADAEYRPEFPGGGSMILGVALRGQTSAATTLDGNSFVGFPAGTRTRFLPGLTYPFKTNPYALVDVRLGYEAPDGAWRVLAFGRNIFNKYYFTNVIDASEAKTRLTGQPATYGITFGLKFR